ncbi:possible anti-sigma factor [Winogradskyella sp. PG-2]|nr:possible anti-sigma factor [Winogradskyella sp. PG-2]
MTKGNTFKVITNRGSITVLGTQFNVNATDSKFEVNCYEGKVAVNYNEDEEILIKGQSNSAKNNKLFGNNHTTNVLNWLNGYTKYNKVELSEVIKDLQKYYKINITLPNKYKKQQFTGNLTHNDFNLALEKLFTSMEIKYNVDKNNTVIIE